MVFSCWIVVLILEELPPVMSSPLRKVRRYRWQLLLLSVYALYLFTTLTLPIVGRAAAGVLLLLGLCGLYRLRGQHYALNKAEKWLLCSFALFSVVSIISFFHWPYSRLAQIHLEDYATFLMLIPLYLLLRQFKFNFTCLLVLLAFTSILLGAISIAQYVAMKYFHAQIFISDNYWSHIWLRPSGGVNPMRYGAVSLILATISLNGILVVRQKAIWLKVMLVLAVIMGLVACFLAQSRGSLLAIPVLTFAYGVYLYRAGRPRFLMVLTVAAVLLVGGLSQNDRVQRTIGSVEQYQEGNSRSPLGARFDMFTAAVILIKQNPVWGHGLGSYLEGGKEVRKANPGLHPDVGTWSNPHNEILLVVVEKGIIGLLTLLVLFAAPAYLFFKALYSSNQAVKFYALSGLSLLVVYAVVGQSVALFQHDVFNHFFTLMVLLFASQIRVIGCMGGMGGRAAGELGEL